MIPIDFESPSVRSAIRFIIYGIMAAIAIIATIFLVFAAQGYDIDRKTGEVIQNGLVLIDSGPESAGIFLNGEFDNDNTPGRLPLPAGDYEIALLRDGYRPWSKNITLEGSEVKWIYYPKLWPETITPVPINTFATTAASSQSPNKRWLVVQSQASVPIFNFIDVDKTSETPLQAVSIPEGILTTAPGGGFGTFHLIEWTQNSDFMLIEHKLGAASEFIIMEHQNPASARNITREVGLSFTQPHFAGSSTSRLFVLINGGVRELDLNNLEVQAPKIENVSYYEVKGDDVIVAAQVDPGSADAKLTLLRDDQTIVVGVVPASIPIHIGFEEFDGNQYFAYYNVSDGTAQIFQNPFDSDTNQPLAPYRVVEQAGAQAMLFSENSQYLSLQTGNQFTVYDFDQDSHYSFIVDEQLIPELPAHWMDGNRLMYFDTAGTINIREFDGANHQQVGSTVPVLGVAFDRSYESMYTFRGAHASSQIILEQSSLVAKPTAQN